MHGLRLLWLFGICFLNYEAVNYSELFEGLLSSFRQEENEQHLSYLHSNLYHFSENVEDLREKHVERFYQYLESLEEIHDGLKQVN